jgi:hypothetical protein
MKEWKERKIERKVASDSNKEKLNPVLILCFTLYDLWMMKCVVCETRNKPEESQSHTRKIKWPCMYPITLCTIAYTKCVVLHNSYSFNLVLIVQHM